MLPGCSVRARPVAPWGAAARPGRRGRRGGGCAVGQVFGRGARDL